MVMTRTLITAEDLWQIPEGDVRRELVRGEVIEMSPVTMEHARIVGNIIELLRAWAKRGPGGFVGPEAGFIVARDPDTVRAADVAYVAPDRIPDNPEKGYSPIAPDLAVEVVSPGESASDVHEKVQDYLAAGTRLVWVVYPRQRSVVAHTPDGLARTCHEADVLEHDEVLPGFRSPVADLFA